jgi:phosphoenolpyruvate carboxylase
MFEITGFKTLMEEEPVGRKSVKIRENSFAIAQHTTICAYKTSKNEGNREALEKLVTRSLFGNINASRNWHK